MRRLSRIMMLCGFLSHAALAQAELDQTRNKLSTVWTGVALNMIGADVLTSFLPGSDSVIVDFAGGKTNVPYFMLGGAVIYEIPISMIFLSKYLPYKANRWVNVAAAILATSTVWGGGSTDPHYLLMAGAETVAMSYIVWTAFKWSNPEMAKNEKFGPGKTHDVGLEVDPRSEAYGLKYSYRF